MAISKRLRYEVMRRDDFACVYCGAMPARSELHVDHVMPVSLGGSDDASNLATSCQDCNNGKASSAPDAPTVAEIDERNLRWRAALAQAARESMEVSPDLELCMAGVQEVFGESFEVGPSERDRIKEFLNDGLPVDVIIDAAHIAVRGATYQRGMFSYMVGVCRNKLRDIQIRAAEIMGTQDGEG